MRLYDKELSTFEAGEETVNLIKTALPKFFDYGSIYIVGSVSTAMLSWYSQDAVSAVNVALQVLNLIIILFNIKFFMTIPFKKSIKNSSLRILLYNKGII